MPQSISRRALLAPALLLPAAAWASEADALLRRLGDGGHLGLMRHALAPGTGDPPGLRLDDCATQRNLGAEGRDQARHLGDRLRQAGIARARVLTSRWCRARETAALLGMGPPEDLDLLDSFFAARADEAARTRALRGWIAAAPLDPPVVLVSHQVNITALTGVFPASGELLVLRRAGADLSLAGRVPPT